jgi:hypothetical protein
LFGRSLAHYSFSGFFYAQSDHSQLHDACLQPHALYIEGEVISSMQQAAASISRLVAMAHGSSHWWWYLNEISVAFVPSLEARHLSAASLICHVTLTIFQGSKLISVALDGRPFVRPFKMFSRPFTWMVSRLVSPTYLLGLSTVSLSTSARLIDHVFHTIRYHAVDPVCILSRRGLSFLVSLLPASMADMSPALLRFVRRCPNAMLLGLLVLVFPLRRCMSAAAAQAPSQYPQQ